MLVLAQMQWLALFFEAVNGSGIPLDSTLELLRTRSLEFQESTKVDGFLQEMISVKLSLLGKL